MKKNQKWFKEISYWVNHSFVRTNLLPVIKFAPKNKVYTFLNLIAKKSKLSINLEWAVLSHFQLFKCDVQIIQKFPKVVK